MSGYEGRACQVLGILDARGQEGAGEYVTVKVELWPDETAILRDIVEALDSGQREGRDLPLLTLGDCGARMVADVEVTRPEC